MEKTKTYAIIAIVIVTIATAGVAYTLINPKIFEETDETIQDALGRKVNIPKQIDSIYCMGAGSLRLISYFESIEKVQATETTGPFNTRNDQTYYLLNKARFSGLPQIPNTPEAILSLNPNLVITSFEDPAAADNMQLQTGIPVYAVNVNLEFGSEFYDQITSLGTLLGEENRALELNAGIANMINEITSKASSVGTKSAYACGMFFYGGASFLKGSGDYLPFDYSNIPNAIESAPNQQPYVITLETLINANPDYMFVDSIGLDGVVDSINDYIKANTGLEHVNAIKNNNVYSTMVYKCYGTNWENQLMNVYYVASVMNEDAYSWEFEDKANEIIELFYLGNPMSYAEIVEFQTGSGCSKVSLN